MNEILTINYESENPTVSARELHEKLHIGCVMKVGKRALYDTRKADLYFDSLTGVK